jgi:NTP pyrophosphatase (non-canonical NTP hydrolase)
MDQKANLGILKSDFSKRTIELLEQLANEIHRTAVEKGWWEKEAVGGVQERSIGDQFANFHAEISEAWEDYRNGLRLEEIHFSETGKPEGIPVELADTIIRIFDTCGQYNIPLAEAMLLKMEYNKTRPYRHGGKVA